MQEIALKSLNMFKVNVFTNAHTNPVVVIFRLDHHIFILTFHFYNINSTSI